MPGIALPLVKPDARISRIRLSCKPLLAQTSHRFEKRCEPRQSVIRAGSVLAHLSKRVVATTPNRALVVSRFLLNTTEETDCSWPNPITLC